MAHRRGIPLGLRADAPRPRIALAQAIGRWGNYFNQELFGRPTTLPWGLEIDAGNMPAQYPARHAVPPDVPVRVARHVAACAVCCC